MPPPSQPFSERHRLAQPKSIRYRDELPGNLRRPIIDLAMRQISSAWLLKVVTQVLDPYGIEPKPLLPTSTNAWPARLIPITDLHLNAVQEAIEGCEWPRVYDVVQSIYEGLKHTVGRNAATFESEINAYFAYAEIGWQLRNGVIETRGDEVFESTLETAGNVLKEDDKPTAARHLQNAISALSARPAPNTSGAVSHATNAIECVLGEITGEAMTLGRYLDKYPDLFHPALKKGLNGIYGYASDEGARHGKEGTEPAREDAEFAVAVCAAACTLLTRKHPK